MRVIGLHGSFGQTRIVFFRIKEKVTLFRLIVNSSRLTRSPYVFFKSRAESGGLRTRTRTRTSQREYLDLANGWQSRDIISSARSDWCSNADCDVNHDADM